MPQSTKPQKPGKPLKSLPRQAMGRSMAAGYQPQSHPTQAARDPRVIRRSRPKSPIELSSPLIKRSLLVGSTLLAGALLILTGNLLNPGSLLSARDPNAQCQGKVQSQSVISRDQLGRFLTVAERDRKAKVRQIVKAPYCTLPAVEVRAGIKAEREAYPLAFDPQTRLVILYEGDEYAGYAFDVRP
jgi:hypothetical protein